jgi:nucleoid DNA-binding protein
MNEIAFVFDRLRVTTKEATEKVENFFTSVNRSLSNGSVYQSITGIIKKKISK